MISLNKRFKEDERLESNQIKSYFAKLSQQKKKNYNNNNKIDAFSSDSETDFDSKILVQRQKLTKKVIKKIKQ